MVAEHLRNVSKHHLGAESLLSRMSPQDSDTRPYPQQSLESDTKVKLHATIRKNRVVGLENVDLDARTSDGNVKALGD